MSTFLTLCKAELRSKVPLVLGVIIASVVAVSGPFGSYSTLNLVQRAVFWTPVVAIGVLTSVAIRTYVSTHKRRLPPRDVAIFSTILVCAVLCPPLYLLTTAMFDDLTSGGARFLEIVLLVASVSIGATALRHSLVTQPQIVGPEIVGQGEEPRLMRRLEPCQRGPLLAISVRDHYVDVQTADGTASLLLRFSDAIAEAAPVEGTQVHRSHWVAWAAVTGVERDGAKLYLRLIHGARVPVSKNHRDKLEVRGLI